MEFENASASGIFQGKKAKRAWSRRFEGAFSQLVDWLWKLEDQRSTSDFEHTFGKRTASFQGLIVVGKGMTLSASEHARLRWRNDRVMIDSKRVEVLTFDEGLMADFDFWLGKYYGV